jgi:hypothetical protein
MARVSSPSADIEYEFYRVAFRKKLTHQGRWCYGKTPMQTFLDTSHGQREVDRSASPCGWLSGPVRGSETHARI